MSPYEQITEIIAGDGERDAKAYAIADTVRRYGDYRWVCLYDVGAEDVKVLGWAGSGPPAYPRFGVTQGLTADVIGSAKPKLVEAVAADPRYLPAFYDTKAELIVPVLVRNAVRGTIDVEAPQAGALGAADIAFLEHCAAVAAPLWAAPVEYELPANLPAPVDDGACDHLPGRELPSLALESTRGSVELRELASGRLVLYIYPRAGGRDFRAPADWDAIPGARGCTPESCSFRDHAAEFAALAARVAGLSVQPLDEQIELAERLQLPFPVIADPGRELGDALALPTFEFEGESLYRRLTLLAEYGRIVKVFYPVFPPDQHGDEVLAWLRSASDPW
jgi:peroxiredoxin/putative methionine-R-sulfoxide reductase with GAF domain